MEQELFKSFYAVGVCRNIPFIVSDTLQRIKKLQIQTDRIRLEKVTFCKRGRLQAGYGENVIRHMSSDRFRSDYRGKP